MFAKHKGIITRVAWCGFPDCEESIRVPDDDHEAVCFLHSNDWSHSRKYSWLCSVCTEALSPLEEERHITHIGKEE